MCRWHGFQISMMVVLLSAPLLASGCVVGRSSPTPEPPGSPSGSGALPWIGPEAIISFSRVQDLEGGAVVERVSLIIHEDGKVEAMVSIERPGSTETPHADQWRGELRISASEVSRLLDQIEGSGLSGMPLVDVGPECRTVYTVSWLQPGGGIATGAGVSFCPENAPPQAAPLLEALNRLSDEAVRRARGGGQ